MRILSVGNLTNYGQSNTCLHRHWSLESIGEVDSVDTAIDNVSLNYKVRNWLFQRGLSVSLPDIAGVNNDIMAKVKSHKYDVVWIDKGTLVNYRTLEFIKKTSPKTKIISYSPDNMALRHNQSQNYLHSLPYYDYVFTNKSYIIDTLHKLGAKNVQFVNNSYESQFHYPRVLSPEDVKKYDVDVGFIGTWEKERFQSILYLAENGINVTVFGDGKWNSFKNHHFNLNIKPPLYSEEYCKALKGFKISLCFLRKMNLDQQTTRSVEIPACGGFMLAERTEEHCKLFKEGNEADFFETNEELLKKCRYYLINDELRVEIARAGTERCIASGYSNNMTIKRMIEIALKNS
ncbi:MULTISPECIES: glycosyltransferase [unclassified Leeuwenhoekiella]|uniref:CgeB family protein n=1 Tax=unclassified Leeuwenhoekiella TaxID=2615029 RepID=UPI000C47A7F0|nr:MULTISPECIES: glycosyltransferase [unclassified Leeuwenhoekiella]MAW97095.1 hypothetical protein [Leeuwenhoekiella sp.]MBA82611.1 hypothetical protein [Leeuwenhoekiella sp.]|tara:strand:- start:17977 stop:19017 length:1041 start_codon:yes stop_codon:yes gene_type:complete